MSRYIAERLLLLIPMILGITLINYTILALAPGDPVSAMINPEARALMTTQQIQEKREALGLNQPFPVRYAIWLKEGVQGNLGYSLLFHLPVGSVIVANVGNTLGLIGISLLFSTVLGIALGIISALKPYSALDYGLTAFAFAGAATPSFFLALLLIFVVSLQLNLLPTGGIHTAGAPTTIDDWLLHVILPAVALSYRGIGTLLRFTRSSMLEVLSQEYIVTARAKGLPLNVVVVRHAFRNALLPVITIVGLRLPDLIGGSILVETVFTYPGIGSILVEATQQRDYPLLMGGVLMTAIFVLLTNLLTDVAYSLADPRIRYN